MVPSVRDFVAPVMLLCYAESTTSAQTARNPSHKFCGSRCSFAFLRSPLDNRGSTMTSFPLEPDVSSLENYSVSIIFIDL